MINEQWRTRDEVCTIGCLLTPKLQLLLNSRKVTTVGLQNRDFKFTVMKSWVSHKMNLPILWETTIFITVFTQWLAVLHEGTLFVHISQWVPIIRFISNLFYRSRMDLYRRFTELGMVERQTIQKNGTRREHSVPVVRSLP